jgi:glycosyltransferase involved in cell wall biosynthesis
MEEGQAPLGLLQRVLGLRGPFDLIYTFSHQPVDVGAARFLRGPDTFWMTDWCDLWSSTGGGLHDSSHWARPLPPFLQGAHGLYTRWSYRLEDAEEIRTAQDADAVSIIAAPMRDYTRAAAIPDDRVLHLISGADTSRIPVLPRSECRAKLGIPEDQLLAVYVANYTPDNQLLDDALGRAWQRRPELHVLSVGPRWYDDRSRVARESRRFHDAGRRPFAEIPAFLGAADFLLMPIRDLPVNRCRWPNKFSDYLASGRATATTAVGDMGRVVAQYGVGVAGSPEATGFADAIEALATAPELRAECGRAARDAAENHFSWRSRIRRLRGYLRHRGVPV